MKITQAKNAKHTRGTLKIQNDWNYSTVHNLNDINYSVIEPFEKTHGKFIFTFYSLKVYYNHIFFDIKIIKL